MKKELLSLSLAAAMITSVAGCGKKDEQASTDGIPTLTWLLPGENQADLQSVEDALNEIFVEKVGAKVDLEFIDQSAFSEKMKMKMATGEKFDMCFTGYVNNYGSAAKGGGIMDITDLIDQVEGLREAIPDFNWEAANVNGRIYGVPNQQISCMQTAVIEYKDISKDYDFDFSTVKTMDDVEPYLAMIKEKDPTYCPFLPAYGVSPWFSDIYQTVGTKMIALPMEATSTDELCYLYETDEWKHGVDQLWSWYSKGYIRSDILSSNDDTNDRKSGSIAVDNELYKPGTDSLWETGYGRPCKFWTIERPILSKGQSTSTMVSLGLSCKDPIKALEIVKLMQTDEECLNLLTYGIEGKHYKMVDNRVEFIENSGYYQGDAGWKFGNQYLAKLTPGQEDTVWEETKKLNEEAVIPSTFGFSFDQDPVKSELSALNSLYTEYEVYNKGAADPATYMDEFVRKMKEAGIEKVYNEVKKQLDEYFASKAS